MIDNKLFSVICKDYDLGTALSEPEFVTGGDINDNYKLATTKGHFFLKILDIENYKRNYHLDKETLTYSLTFSENLSEIMSQNKVPTVSALRAANNQKLCAYEDKLVLVYPFIDARILPIDEITNDEITKIAILLATIHTLNIEDFGDKSAHQKWMIMVDWFSTLTESKPWLQLTQIEPKINDSLEFIEKHCNLIPQVLKKPERLVITHNDTKPKNILWDRNNNPVIIDWEAGGYMPMAVDYLDTLLAWCLEFKNESFFLNTNKAKVFIENYKRIQPTITINDNTISLVVAKWIVWLTFCANSYIKKGTDNEKQLFYEALHMVIFLKDHSNDLKALDHI